jgi:hypothetical protein
MSIAHCPHPSVEQLESRIAPASLVVAGTASDDLLTILASGAGTGTYQLNGGPVIPFSDVAKVEFRGGDGDDMLSIVNPDGSIFAPAEGIVYFGEGHRTATGDGLIMSGGGGESFVQTWVLGATPDAGTFILTNGILTQTIQYAGLEPVIDTVAAASLTVSGDGGPNFVNYVAGAAGRGLIRTDSYESTEFANKTTLIIQPGNSRDTIFLNNPTTPTGLTGITIHGAEPTDGDVVVVNGIPGTLDNLRYVPTGRFAGQILNDSASQPPVTFTGIEEVHFIGQEADGDGARLEGTLGNDWFEFSPGTLPGSGMIQGTLDLNNTTGNGPFPLSKIEFTGMAVEANDIDFNFFVPGGTDTFILNGTANADAIAVGAGENGGLGVSNVINGKKMANFEIYNVANILVRGSGAVDTLTFTANFNGTTSVNLATAVITGLNGVSVAFSDFDQVGFNSSGPASSLTLAGTSADETFAVTPHGNGAGSFTIGGVGVPLARNTVFTYAGQGMLTVNGDAGFDVVGVLGTEGNDTITSAVFTVTRASSTVAVTAVERLDVFGLGGNDLLNLSSFTAAPTRLLGGDGHDVLIGSPQDDLLDGGPGQDTLRGGGGNNTLLGNGAFGFTAPTAYDVGKLPKSVTVADLNGDTFADLVVANSAAGTVSVLLGTVTGRFADPVDFTTGGKLPNSLAVADFNGDFKADLAVGNGGTKTVGVLLGNGDGTFLAASPFTTGKAPGAVQAADFDNNGIVDLVFLMGASVGTLTGAGNGIFGSLKTFATGGVKPVALAIADFNQDNFADIVTANNGSNNVSLLTGTGTAFNAAVKFKTGSKPIALAAGDFDRDGKLDLAVANAGNRYISVLPGNGNVVGPQFQRQIKIATTGIAMAASIAATDLDGDGIVDLAVSSAAGSLGFLLGLGTGLFRSPIVLGLGDSKMKLGALAIGDFNGDGAPDLAAVGSGTADVSVVLSMRE